jgi:hypothetical protein
MWDTWWIYVSLKQVSLRELQFSSAYCRSAKLSYSYRKTVQYAQWGRRAVRRNKPAHVTSHFWTKILYSTYYIHTRPKSEICRILISQGGEFVAPCRLAEVHQRFEGPCYLHHRGDQHTDDGEIVKFLPDHTALQSRRQPSSSQKFMLGLLMYTKGFWI